MKKVIGLVTIVVALWLGATAYIGSQIEPFAQKYMSKTNKMYKSFGIKYDINITEKSFFSSKARISIEYTDQVMKQMMQAFGQTDMEYEIEHGPLLFKNGFAFGAARMTSDISLRKYLGTAKEFQELFSSMIQDKDIKINSSILITLYKQMIFEGTSTAFHINTPEGLKIAVSPISMTGDFDIETMAGRGLFQVSSIDVIDTNNIDNNMHSKNILMDIDIEKMLSAGLFLGDMSLKIEELALSLDTNAEKISFAFSPAIYGSMSQDSDDGSIELVYNLQYRHLNGDTPKNMIPVQEADIMLQWSGLGLAGLEALGKWSQDMQTTQATIFASMDENSTDPEAMAKAMLALQEMQKQTPKNIVEILKQVLIKNKTSLSIKGNLYTKDSNDNLVDMRLTYIADDLKGDYKEILKQFKQNMLNMLTLDAELSLDETLLNHIPSGDFAKASLKQFETQGLVKKENNTYKTKLHYKPNSLRINDKDMPQMLQMLQMIQASTKR